MRAKFLAALLAVASLFLAGSINAAAAAQAPGAEAAPQARVETCDSPPDLPEATPENRDRFVNLWLARIKDKDWLHSFTAAEDLPAGVKAEGFHDMDPQVQLWLNSCLLDKMLEVANEAPSNAKYNEYLSGLTMVIFGKQGVKDMKEELNKPADPSQSQALPTKKDLTAEALGEMVSEGKQEQSLTSAQQPRAEVQKPAASSSENSAASASQSLKNLVGAPDPTLAQSSPQALTTTSLVPTGLEPSPLTQLPLVPTVLAAVDSVLQLISKIQGILFTLPVINILASAFYKICAESATMPLKCSISLPVGIPIPADVTGDNLPDVLGTLGAFTNLKDIGAKFQVVRLTQNATPLPAHVFAVYDTPIVKKRIEFGFDGRASTLGYRNEATFTLENAVKAVTGDIQVKADVMATHPGAKAALSFAVKDLVGDKPGVLPSEENPLGGAIQFAPFPERFSAGAHLIHTTPRSQDIITLESTTPSKVNAVIDQRTTTTPVKSSRRFTAEVDKLPTSVTVDLTRDGEHQSIDYRASAPIDSVSASDKTIPNIAENSYTQSIYQVKGVPTEVDVDLLGAQDITYKANAKIPEVSFQTETVDQGDLKQRITAAAHSIPKNIHVLNKTDQTEQRVTYTADDKLGDIQLGMFDRNENDIRTNLVAKATGIPTEMEFVATKATGAYDFVTNTGIDLIEATLTQQDGDFLPLPGKDHATVLKRGDELGVDFRLSGFREAHFDGHEETKVGLGLSPGGQSFDAIADIDDPDDGPNVLAKAHISALPSDLEVTFDPDNGTADYAASSVIPLLTASFTDRDTEMFGEAKLTDLPKTIGLTFNTTGEVPEVTYDADSRLGSIELTYSEKPGGLAVHGLISDLPKYMKIGGNNPIVFDARTAAADPSGSSYLGQILFQYATDGVFASPPTTDDHVYLDTDMVDSTHAELQYTGLKYLGVDTSNQELHATIKNTDPRLLRAYVYTPQADLTGFIKKVPAEITVSQVDDLVSYDASSSIEEISTHLTRANGDDLAVQIKDVPSSIDLLFDGAGSKLVWDSSSATGLVSAIAHLTPATIGGDRAFDAGLTITDIPVHWDATWANGNVAFNTSPGGIGSIAVNVTNHGSYTSLPGDHLSAVYDKPNNNLDASLRVSNLQKVAFEKLAGNPGGFDAKLNMGTHGSLGFNADVNLGTTVLKALGSFDHLPSQIHLRSEGGRITYDGDDNPDLQVSVEAGAPAALAVTPSAPSVHGVSVRDGASGADKAVKAKLYLTGLPDHLDLNSPAGTYQVNGYHPTISQLVVDAVLTTLAAEPLTLQLQQGVPTASPVNFTFGPFLTDTAPDGTHTLSLNYTANQDLGALTASATYGNTDEAKLEISEIPSSISVNAGFGADTKTVGIAMSHGIADITASYKKVGAANFAAQVHLHDVPSAVNINIGKKSGSGDGADVDAPVFDMTTSTAGMDIDAFATAEIADPVDANAAVSLAVTDLGSHVTGDLIGNRLHITSSPATGSFSLQAAGRVQKNISLDWDGGIFQNEGALNVDLKIHKVTLGLTGFSDVNVRLGFTTGLDGSFSSFTFGQESNLTVDLREKFYVHIDWPDPFGSDDITLVNVPHTTIPLGNVVPRWHINKNTYGTIFEIPFFHFLIGDCHVSFDARPGPGFTTAGPIFTLGAPQGAPGETPAWLLTPDISLLGISLPDFALDIIAFFSSPYGHDIDAYPECEVFDIF